MQETKQLNTIDQQPFSTDRFLSFQNQKIAEFELINNNNIQSHIFDEQTQSIENQIDEYIDKIEGKMKEINPTKYSTSNQLIYELRAAHSQNKSKKSKLVGVNKIIALFLSFYGFWRDAETIMRSVQRNTLIMNSQKSSKKEINDIYDFILELLENENEMKSMILSLIPDNNEGVQVEKEENASPFFSDGKVQFKETLFLSIIQTFNIRMNVINEEIYKWLIVNEKLNFIEIILDNGRLCASQKQNHFKATKSQENKMLKWLHEYLIVQKKYNNEIELLLNMNENNLELLSSKYMLYINRQEGIPTNYIVNKQIQQLQDSTSDSIV